NMSPPVWRPRSCSEAAFWIEMKGFCTSVNHAPGASTTLTRPRVSRSSMCSSTSASRAARPSLVVRSASSICPRLVSGSRSATVMRVPLASKTQCRAAIRGLRAQLRKCAFFCQPGWAGSKAEAPWASAKRRSPGSGRPGASSAASSGCGLRPFTGKRAMRMRRPEADVVMARPWRGAPARSTSDCGGVKGGVPRVPAFSRLDAPAAPRCCGRERQAGNMPLYVLALFATALLLGAMMFFSFIVLPVAHRKLEPLAARRFVRAIFPVYYKVIAALGAVATVCLVIVDDRLLAAAMAFVAVLAAFVDLGLRPRIYSLQDATQWGEDDARPVFRRLHRLSVLINLAQILAVTMVLLALAY